MMRQRIDHSVEEAVQASSVLLQEETKVFLESAAALIVSCYKSGGKLLVAGNGGSLCDAAHLAEELTGQFRHKRPALPAIALCEPGFLTCVGNDMGYAEVFARGVEAFGKKGDVFIGLSTSGNSENVIKGFSQAKKLGLRTIAFLGKDGGKLKGVADCELIVANFPFSDRIQEVHMAAIHILIEIIEHELFY